MSDLEERLHAALTGSAPAQPVSPDLFARVVGSIEDDRRRRRRHRRTAIAWTVGASVTLAAVITMNRRGITMPWWVIEVITTAVLVAVALWLGPFIKRFGRAYAADVFHDNPLTGKSYIVLADIVYYLIFAAYILFTVRFEPADAWAPPDGGPTLVTAAQLKETTYRLGGILLIIGVLHGLNIVLMPVLGRLFSLNRRLPEQVAKMLR